ncbi:lantibiotic dehydratase [Kitasatospora sp. NPDC002227]|uniref:lantibiotic dehydratase n=1 Tax=Kitasatospora sp. NPDC002227 TaxID=3154773 RepID=UPI00331908E0
MLRVGALPVELVHGLRSPEAFGWAEELVAEEERLAELGARLSDPLSLLVKAAPDAARRRRVLEVRRQVFNNRLPERPAEALGLIGELDPAVGELLLHWLSAQRRLAELRVAGEGLLERELVRTRAELHRLAELDELRLGLLLASPTLESRLDRLAEPGRAADKRTRKMERSLLSYLYRTACKTSPFSTFTPVVPGVFRAGAGAGAGAGEPDGSGAGADRPGAGREWRPSAAPTRAGQDELVLGAARRSHPRLNVVVLARLAELIAADPGRRRDLPVALASGWELTEDRIRYVRRSVTAGDDRAAVSFDAARDRLFYLRLSGLLERLLGLFRERPLIRHGELADRLCVADGGPEAGAEAERYLAALLDVGMLQLPLLATDVHTGDPLRAFRDALRSLERPWAETVADRLGAPIAAIDRYPAGDLAARRALLTELRRELTEIQRDLGDAEAGLPQTLLYEDVTAEEVTADPAPWQQLAARPLRQLAPVLPVFDLGLAQRLTLKGFFLARYGRGGRCEDLLQLVHDFHEDIFNQYLQFTALKPGEAVDGGYPPEENWLHVPELTALDRARAELARRMRLHREQLPDDAEELVLDSADLAAVAAELGAAGGAFAPHSHFVQLARREGDPMVVLNHSYGGLAFPFTRFTHCLEPGQNAELSGSLRAAQPEGAVFAEVTAGAATTNLNLHVRLTDYELVCPGETSTAPETARIELDDLYVVHDAAEDRLVLRSRRLRAEVIPLYLGYLVPMVLPEIPRSLLLFSPTSRVTPELWRGVPAGPGEGGVTHRPRVRLGSLVLHRRSWTAQASALPQPVPGEGESERFLRWQRWRRRHRLPAQLFVRARQDGPGPAAKPQYLDFAGPLSLAALEGLAAGAAELVLEEALPGADALHVRSERGSHVAELALEIIPSAGAAAPEQQRGATRRD